MYTSSEWKQKLDLGLPVRDDVGLANFVFLHGHMDGRIHIQSDQSGPSKKGKKEIPWD